MTTISMRGSATVTINGETFTGRNVSISNGKVLIDGKEADTGQSQQITIDITGDVDRVETEAGDVRISGRAGSVKTMSGDVVCHGDIQGNASTMSGDISCQTLAGSASTMSGNITR